MDRPLSPEIFGFRGILQYYIGCKEITMIGGSCTKRNFYGNTAQFGKKPQPGFLAQFKVWKTKEYCMYFSFFKLKKWGKKTAAARRHNCAVLPYKKIFPLPSLLRV